MNGLNPGWRVPRVFLIHAFPGAIGPIHAAMEAEWPEAEAVDLVDGSLGIDRARYLELPPALYKRIASLAHHARAAGADAILYTCSAFGPAISAVAAEIPVPVLKPDEAMFDAALGQGRRIGLLATFGPALVSTEQDFRSRAAATGLDVDLTTILVPGARDALAAGDVATHNRLVVEAAKRMEPVDALMLAHFSMAPTAQEVRAAVRVPVLSSPEAAVAKLRRLVNQRIGDSWGSDETYV